MRAVSKRIFLHVGSPKTGTTFLQQVLWSQRDLAREQGLLLPLESFHDHFLATLDVRELTDRPETPPRASGIWERTVEEARAWDGDVLVSHELFAAATRAQATAAVEAFGPDAEVHVVLTARDLVRQIPAEWQEHVKHRDVLTYQEFVALLREERKGTWFWRVQDYPRVLGRWGAVVPADRVHVVTVPPAGAPPEQLWTRFAALLGLDPEAFDLGGHRANTSLGYEQAELLRRVNAALGDRLPLPGPYPVDVKDLFAQTLLTRQPGAKIALAGDDVGYAVERSRRMADAIAALGVDVVGDLDELVPALPETPPPPPQVTDERLLEESVTALAALLEAYSGQRREAQQLRRRVAAFEQRPVTGSVRSRLASLSERSRAVMAVRRVWWRVAEVLRARRT
jgi:hypothetical protein